MPLTASLMSVVLMMTSPIYEAGRYLGVNRLIPSAAFGVEELRKSLEGFRGGRAAQKKCFRGARSRALHFSVCLGGAKAWNFR
jgi:hypothetical protein